MLIKLLFILLALAGFRFLARLAKALLSSTRGPEIHSQRSADKQPIQDQPVVDVEFTEENADDKRPGNTE